MQALTTEQMETIATVKAGDPVRFMHDGRSVDIVTGEYASERHANVMYQRFYWHLSRDTARLIAKLTGTRAAFDAAS